jgi:DNA-binding CsgD family transcriptional regulator
MATRPLIREQESLSTSTVADIKSLVRQLVKRAVDDYQSGAPGPEASSDQEVLLDEESNGVRCLLVRSHPKPVQGQIALSPREQEIARMVAEGHPNKTIAAVLEISAWTVCTHMRRIFAKLNVRSRAAMVARLLEERSVNRTHIYKLPLDK